MLSLALLLGLVQVACGKPATAEDCEKIVARITQLELKAAKITDSTEIQNQIQETKTAFEERAKAECVGKLLSKDALKCIDSATTSGEILDTCLK